MSYTPATQFPANIKFFQWSLPSAPNPRLAKPIDEDDTTIVFTDAPKDKDGTVIRGDFIMNCQNEDSYTENMYIPAGTLTYTSQSANFTVGSVLTGGTSGATAIVVADSDSGTTGTLTLGNLSGTFTTETITDEAGGSATAGTFTNSISADGLTASYVVRGVRPEGLDWFTGSTSYTAKHGADSPVGCSVSPVLFRMMRDALNGTINSGGANWYIGREKDEDINIYAANGDANLPFWGYDSGTSQYVYSNDGVSTTPFGTGSGVTGGDGITVTAGDIDIDLTDTTIFRSVRNGNETRAVITESSDGQIDDSFLRRAMPVGSIIPYAGSTAPTDWLLCDGTTGLDSTSDTTLADLYAVIGTTFGGTGAADFALPDMRGNFPLGKDNMGGSSRDRVTDTEADTLGDEAGAQTHTLTTGEIPAHTHDVDAPASATNGSPFVTGWLSNGNNGTGTVTIASQSAGGGGAHENMPPYMTFNYIIKK